MKHVIVTNLDLHTLIKKIEAITLPYEKISTTQFHDTYYYKGKITANKFVIENIYVGYNNPSDVIKGEIIVENDKTLIYIEIENVGNDLIKVLFLALLLPFLIIISLVLAFNNGDYMLLSCLVVFFICFILIKKKPNPNTREEEIICDFKKKIKL
jgi:hypothetical protein